MNSIHCIQDRAVLMTGVNKNVQRLFWRKQPNSFPSMIFKLNFTDSLCIFVCVFYFWLRGCSRSSSPLSLAFKYLCCVYMFIDNALSSSFINAWNDIDILGLLG